MKNLKYLMLVLTLLFGASIASAQGCIRSQKMNGGSINGYTTQSTSGWHNLTLTQTTTANGYINYTPSEYCRVTGNPHYAAITQNVGTTTHSVKGVYVCPSCDFYAQDTIVIVGVPGVIYAGVVTASANCAAGGWQFVKKFLDFKSKWAVTYTQVLPNQPTYVWVGVIPFCSNTAPTIAGVVPDVNPNVAGPNITPPSPVLYGLGFVERNTNFSRVWHQAGPAFFTDTNFLPTGPKPPCDVEP
jgi:hypothetical protein